MGNANGEPALQTTLDNGARHDAKPSVRFSTSTSILTKQRPKPGFRRCFAETEELACPPAHHAHSGSEPPALQTGVAAWDASTLGLPLGHSLLHVRDVCVELRAILRHECGPGVVAFCRHQLLHLFSARV
jgi:hypothetical protein